MSKKKEDVKPCDNNSPARLLNSIGWNTGRLVLKKIALVSKLNMGLSNKGWYGMFFACGVWCCIANVSSVSPLLALRHWMKVFSISNLLFHGNTTGNQEENLHNVESSISIKEYQHSADQQASIKKMYVPFNVEEYSFLANRHLRWDTLFNIESDVSVINKSTPGLPRSVKS